MWGNSFAQSADWLRGRYVECVEGLGRGLRQELEEVTKRIRLPELQRSSQQELELLTGRLASRGRLRIDTALGEATLSRAKPQPRDSSADVDEMVPPLLRRQRSSETNDERCGSYGGYSLGLVMPTVSSRE
jgi:hypothetical protein